MKQTLLTLLAFILIPFVGSGHNAPTELPAPKALPATNISETKFTANWESVNGATLYLLSVYTYSEDNSRDYFLEDDEMTNTSCNIENLNSKLQYYYVVKAKNETSVSVESEEIMVEKEEEGGDVHAAQLLEPTNVTENSFTANWKTVKGTSVYWFYLIETYTAEEDMTYYIMNEDFEKITQGTISKPVVGAMEDTLDPYTETQGWEAMNPLFARGMVGLSCDINMLGSAIFTPRMNLSQNDGKFKVEINTLSSNIGDVLSVIKSCSDASGTEPIDRQEYTFTKKNQSENYQVELTHEEEFAIGGIDLTLMTSGSATFLEDIKITKVLRAGDFFSYNYQAQVGNRPGEAVQSISIEFDPRPGFTYSYAVVVPKTLEEYPFMDFLGYENRMEVPIYLESTPDIETQEAWVYAYDRQLHVNLKEKAMIEVYDIMGKKLLSVQAVAGTQSFPLPEQGIYIIKADNKVTKVVNR